MVNNYKRATKRIIHQAGLGLSVIGLGLFSMVRLLVGGASASVPTSTVLIMCFPGSAAAQVEATPSQRSAAEPSEAARQEEENRRKEVECMRARQRVRELRTVTWLGAVPGALVIYWFLMLSAARRLAAALKWLLSPILGCLLVATLMVWFENDQLGRACQESGGLRIDTFLITFIRDYCVAQGLFFGGWGLVNYFRQHRRFETLKD